MSDFNTPTPARGGILEVYFVLLIVAFLLLALGAFIQATANMAQSSVGNQAGGMFTIVDQR
jgi:uncharacterized membrane protein